MNLDFHFFLRITYFNFKSCEYENIISLVSNRIKILQPSWRYQFISNHNITMLYIIFEYILFGKGLRIRWYFSLSIRIRWFFFSTGSCSIKNAQQNWIMKMKYNSNRIRLRSVLLGSVKKKYKTDPRPCWTGNLGVRPPRI